MKIPKDLTNEKKKNRERDSQWCKSREQHKKIHVHMSRSGPLGAPEQLPWRERTDSTDLKRNRVWRNKETGPSRAMVLCCDA